jgi:ABC-type nitrate/sulfonate/bicarbonate transport system substrate-binding protein
MATANGSLKTMPPLSEKNSKSELSRPLRVSFLALTDAAPFAVAEERGLFAKHGVRVRLSREVGWATIREKIVYGELDAAQAPAPMLWSTSLGIDSIACPVTTGLVLNLHGNALTLSERLWEAGIRDLATLREEARRRRGERKLTFGVVFNFSSHHVLLRAWLSEGGINPDRDVRIAIVPPAQMFRNLSAGTIDGYCAGEPWNSLAVREKIGWCPTWSAAQQPGHVEKILMVTERFANAHPVEHAALIAALVEACAWCDEPANREPLAQLLSRSGYINQSARTISPALLGTFDCGHGRTENVPDFHVFHADQANLPSIAKATAIQKELVAAALLPAGAATAQLTRRLFREDIFNYAIHPTTQHELVAS